MRRWLVACVVCMVSAAWAQEIPGWKAHLGKWQLNEGVIEGNSGYLLADGDIPEDFVLTASVQVDSWDDGMFGFRFRAAPPAEGETCYRYLFRKGQTITLDKVVNGKWTALQTQSAPIPTGQWLQVRIAAKGAEFRLFCQGKEIFRVTDASPIETGGIALWASKGMSAKFKDVEIAETGKKTAARTDRKKAPVPDESTQKKSEDSAKALSSTPGPLPGAGVTPYKPPSGKIMWHWSNNEQHVLVVPYAYFRKDLDEVLESIFGKGYCFLAVGVHNEFGKTPILFNLTESLAIKMKDGRLFGTVDPLNIIHDELDEKIDAIKKEKRENESLRVRIGFKVLDAFDDKKVYERAKRQNLTSVENIDKRNKVLEFQIKSLENLTSYFRELSVNPGEKKMCLMALRTTSRLSGIHSISLVLADGEPQWMEPIRVSRKLMEECGIGQD